jgi:hypothetical protein
MIIDSSGGRLSRDKITRHHQYKALLHDPPTDFGVGRPYRRRRVNAFWTIQLFGANQKIIQGGQMM